MKKQVITSSKHQLKTFLLIKQNGKNQIALQNNCSYAQHQNATAKISPNSKIQTKLKDRETQAISNIHQTERKVKKDLQEMIEQYKNEAEKMMVNHGHDPEKQAQIRNQLKKLQTQKQQRRVKFQYDLKRLQQKRQTVNQSNHMSQGQKSQKRKSIEKRIQRIKQRERKRQDQQLSFAKFYGEFKAMKPLFKQLQEEYNSKAEKQIQEKILRYKHQTKQKLKPMDLESITQFQQNYMTNKYEIERLRLQNKLLQKKREEANMEQLNQLYKGHCHSLVLEELAERNNKQNYSYEKNKRIREYSQLVRDQYKPRTMKSSVDIDEDQNDSKALPQTQRGKRVIKQRYLKGQYQGKMVTYEKVPLSHNQQIHKGIQYLQFLKSLPKKPKTVEVNKTITPELKPKAQVYRIKRPQNPLYRASKRYQSIDLNLKDANTDSVRKIMQFMRFRREQLKSDQKLLKNANPKSRKQWENNQKHYDSELVNNIEQKLQILKKL